MKNVLIAIAAMIAVTGCTTPEKTALVGSAAGAAIGGISSGTWGGAAVGAAAGAVGGYLIGKVVDRPGYCRYRDPRTGHEYVERCS
jgi:membrane protein DedA with SNARE-associated domain